MLESRARTIIGMQIPGKVTFHSRISHQRSGNGNKVGAIMKSPARGSGRGFGGDSGAGCACVHPLVRSCPLRTHLSEINIQRDGPPVVSGLSHSEGDARNQGRRIKKSDISLKPCAAVRPANACVCVR